MLETFSHTEFFKMYSLLLLLLVYFVGTVHINEQYIQNVV